MEFEPSEFHPEAWQSSNSVFLTEWLLTKICSSWPLKIEFIWLKEISAWQTLKTEFLILKELRRFSKRMTSSHWLAIVRFKPFNQKVLSEKSTQSDHDPLMSRFKAGKFQNETMLSSIKLEDTQDSNEHSLNSDKNFEDCWLLFRTKCVDF